LSVPDKGYGEKDALPRGGKKCEKTGKKILREKDVHPA
jgi:hypothetical protein